MRAHARRTLCWKWVSAERAAFCFAVRRMLGNAKTQFKNISPHIATKEDLWVGSMMQKKQERRTVLLSVPVQAAEREKYERKWNLLKEKSAKEYSAASVAGMVVYKKYNSNMKIPENEIGYVARLINLIPPSKLMENNKRVSWEDMNEAVLLADGAQNDPARIVIFRDDGLFVIARRNSHFAGNK